MFIKILIIAEFIIYVGLTSSISNSLLIDNPPNSKENIQKKINDNKPPIHSPLKYPKLN